MAHLARKLVARAALAVAALAVTASVNPICRHAVFGTTGPISQHYADIDPGSFHHYFA